MRNLGGGEEIAEELYEVQWSSTRHIGLQEALKIFNYLPSAGHALRGRAG